MQGDVPLVNRQSAVLGGDSVLIHVDRAAGGVLDGHGGDDLVSAGVGHAAHQAVALLDLQGHGGDIAVHQTFHRVVRGVGAGGVGLAVIGPGLVLGLHGQRNAGLGGHLDGQLAVHGADIIVGGHVVLVLIQDLEKEVADEFPHLDREDFVKDNEFLSFGKLIPDFSKEQLEADPKLAHILGEL